VIDSVSYNGKALDGRAFEKRLSLGKCSFSHSDSDTRLGTPLLAECRWLIVPGFQKDRPYRPLFKIGFRNSINFFY